jgi:hypothetical protein
MYTNSDDPDLLERLARDQRAREASERAEGWGTKDKPEFYSPNNFGDAKSFEQKIAENDESAIMRNREGSEFGVYVDGRYVGSRSTESGAAELMDKYRKGTD